MTRAGAFKAVAVVGRQGGVASWCGWDVSGGGSGAGWRAAEERGCRRGRGARRSARGAVLDRRKKKGRGNRRKEKKERKKKKRRKENREKEKLEKKYIKRKGKGI
jgi:hypothetical protein